MKEYKIIDLETCFDTYHMGDEQSVIAYANSFSSEEYHPNCKTLIQALAHLHDIGFKVYSRTLK